MTRHERGSFTVCEVWPYMRYIENFSPSDPRGGQLTVGREEDMVWRIDNAPLHTLTSDIVFACRRNSRKFVNRGSLSYA